MAFTASGSPDVIRTAVTIFSRADETRVFHGLSQTICLTSSLVRSETVDELPNGGKRVAYTYGMAGISLEGHLEATEYEPGSRIRWVMTGDLDGEITWQFEETEGGHG